MTQPNVLFAGSALRKSIFLAGPTPREPLVPSWRPEAIAILGELGFEGDVLVPERADWASLSAYLDQVNWEWEGLNLCTQAVFWVPRDLADMPAFTTNVEYGLMASSSKCVFGRPEGAPKTRYLDAVALRHGIPIRSDLRATLALAAARCAMPFASWLPGSA